MRVDQDESRPIYDGSFFRIGQFRRGPRHPGFGGLHQTSGALMVFPRTSVTITFAGQEPVVADPNVVMFYNRGQVYSRGKLSESGDLCDSFGFDPALVADAIRPYDAYVDDEPMQPFSFSHGPSDTNSYLLQRLVVNHILKDEPVDRLFIEETILRVLKQVIDNRFRQHAVLPAKKHTGSEKETVEAIQKLVGTRFEQNLSLEEIAGQLNYSPFHLCRIFHKYTGKSIHKYLKQLRLRASLEYISQPNTDLTDLALKIGFASHSHFTEAFRKAFGAPPSKLRNPTRKQMRQLLSKISIV
jgi:AraC family transcriptional regulator